MQSLSVPKHRDVLVGLENNDDAGVYRLDDDTALIQTLDFITPIVDDPFVYGQIAACNSLSDVYAMGGRPLTAMNIVCFPVKKFSLDVLAAILRGGLEVLARAGVPLLGGHSIDDEEMKYGLSVTGIIRPDQVKTNHGLREGDRIILTKPLGTGVISTAVKAGTAPGEVIGSFIRSMITLNDRASQVMQSFEVHACTDVTGFGLLGHLKEMLAGDPLDVRVFAREIPLLPGALEQAEAGLIPGGMYRNRDFVADLCALAPSVPRAMADILFDPQTSGGLLIAVPDHDAAPLLSALRNAGIADASLIAEVVKSGTASMKVE